MQFLKKLILGSLWTAIGVTLALATGATVPNAFGVGVLFAIVAYMAFDFDHLKRSCFYAWHRARYIGGVRIDIPLALIGWGIVAGASVGSSGFLMLILLGAPGSKMQLLAMAMGISVLLYPLMALLLKDQETFRIIAKRCNVFVAAYWMIIGAYRGARWLWQTGLPLLGRFLRHLACEIYAEVHVAFAASVFAGIMTGWRHHSVPEGVACFATLFTLQYAALHVPVRRYLAHRKT